MQCLLSLPCHTPPCSHMPRRVGVFTRCCTLCSLFLDAQKFSQCCTQPHFWRRLGGFWKQKVLFTFDQPGIQISLCKSRTSHKAGKKIDIVGHPHDFNLGQGLQHTRAGMRSWRAVAVVPDDQLGNHRIVIRRDFIPRRHASIHAYKGRFIGISKMNHSARRGQETFSRIFGINTRFQCMAANRDLLLHQRQRLTSADF